MRNNSVERHLYHEFVKHQFILSNEAYAIKITGVIEKRELMKSLRFFFIYISADKAMRP